MIADVKSFTCYQLVSGFPKTTMKSSMSRVVHIKTGAGQGRVGWWTIIAEGRRRRRREHFQLQTWVLRTHNVQRASVKSQIQTLTLWSSQRKGNCEKKLWKGTYKKVLLQPEKHENLLPSIWKGTKSNLKDVCNIIKNVLKILTIGLVDCIFLLSHSTIACKCRFDKKRSEWTPNLAELWMCTTSISRWNTRGNACQDPVNRPSFSLPVMIGDNLVPLKGRQD